MHLCCQLYRRRARLSSDDVVLHTCTRARPRLNRPQADCRGRFLIGERAEIMCLQLACTRGTMCAIEYKSGLQVTRLCKKCEFKLKAHEHTLVCLLVCV